MELSGRVTLPSIVDLRFALAATVSYMVLYYVYMIMNVKHKYEARADLKKSGAAKLEKGGLRKLVAFDPGYLRGARSFLNMNEQAPAFLTTMWAYVLFVDPYVGGILGLVYVGCRAMYYPFYDTMPMILLCTAPNYCVIWFFMFKLGLLTLSAFQA